MCEQSKLIVIRGPSGVGKSTVAKALMHITKRPTVLVDLDHYRFGFVNPPKENHNLEYEMSASDIHIALEKGFDVIFDGNFSVEKKDPFLDKLFAHHPNENYIFYLEASLDETLERHKTKTNPRISISIMKEVYKFASPIGHKDEIVIPESSTLEETISKIVQVTGILKGGGCL
jgi:guanylate kinase